MPTDLVARAAPPAHRFRLCRVVLAIALYRAARQACRLADTLADLAEHLHRK